MSTKFFRSFRWSLVAILVAFLVAWLTIAEPRFVFWSEPKENFVFDPNDLDKSIENAIALIQRANQDVSRRIATGLLIAMIGVVGAWLAEYFKGEDEHNESMDSLKQALASVTECRYLGVGDAALDAVMSRAAKAKEVWNTLVLFGSSGNDLAGSGYSKEQRDQIGKCRQNVLDNKGSWTDIVSQPIVRPSAPDWMDSSAKQVGNGYRVLRLKAVYPVTNLMILRYENGTREAIFGWGHHSQDRINAVFLTTEKQLVRMWESYWGILEKDAVEFSLTDSRSIAATDITGLWFSTAYYCDGRAACQGIPKGETNPVNVALVSIGLREDRAVVVNGIIVRNDTQCPIESLSANLDGNQLWFSTRSSETIFNSGWYRFSQPNLEEFCGHFFDSVAVKNEPSSGGQQHYTLKTLLLFGKKVTAQWPAGFALPPSVSPTLQNYLPDDPKIQDDLLKLCQQWWADNAKAQWPELELVLKPEEKEKHLS